METRRYDEALGKTIVMRTKENAEDYRFITDPDLPSMRLTKEFVEEIRKTLPETPEQKLKKLLEEYNVSKEDALILFRNIELVEFFEALAEEGINVRENLSWITVELLRILNYNKASLVDSDVEIKPTHLAELIKMVNEGKITKLKGKQIMNDFFPESFSISEKGDIEKIAEDAVVNLCKQVIDENEKAVIDYKSGNKNSLNFLVGQVMKLSNRRADFETATRELTKILDKEE
jgi:aspartyl-tRNA(Asn)/glutamyl-tRNA(Gln) amidotransferase subunit B